MTKIFSISCSKNESDIVETFIRVNARIVDIFIFIDDSIDSTRIILNKLKEEGFNIIIFYRNNNSNYDQSASMTNGLMEGVKLGKSGDFYIPLDCDEFLTQLDRDSFLHAMNQIPDNHVGFQFWMTYIPISENFNSEKENGLKKMFRQKGKPSPKFGKIIIPFNLASNIIISTGSHEAFFHKGGQVNFYIMTYFLAHFPIRDSQQIIRKTISALDGLIRKKSRRKGEGFHVYDVLRKIIHKKFEISLIELQKMAQDYAEVISSENTVLGDYPLWLNDYELKYQSIINADQVKCLAEIIINLWENPLLESEFLELQRNLSLN